MDLSKEMRNPRKPIMKSRPGEAWFYVAAHGIQIYVANHKGKVASMSFNLTRRQLTRALEIMDDASGLCRVSKW